MPNDTADAMTLEALPARQGDCLLLTWGPPSARHRILVDGGPVPAYAALHARLSRLAPAERYLDLVVITHIDADHIEGIIKLLNDASLGLAVGDVWFNGYRHLPSDDHLAGPHGEYLSALIEHRGLSWNSCFGGAAVRRPTGGLPPSVQLDEGMTITVLGPSDRELAALRPVWERECRRAGLLPGDTRAALPVLQQIPKYNPMDSYLGAGGSLRGLADTTTTSDDSAANASSITLLLERDGSSVLLTGDATPEPLGNALDAVLAQRGSATLPVDVYKLPHHGSARNVTRDTVERATAETYLVSTDGSFFHHPDEAAMARVLEYGTRGSTLAFNHRTETTSPWEAPPLLGAYQHRVVYPERASDGVCLVL